MNTCRRIAAIAGLSCAIAGFAPVAGAGEGPTTPAQPGTPEKSESGGIGWYVGTGFGGGFGAKFKQNGKSVTFSDSLQGTTDKTPLLAINLLNAGVTLGPSLMLGFAGSLVAQSATNAAGNTVRRQINNYFAALTWFPFEQGLFVRGGGGPSNILIDNSTSNTKSSGYGVLLGAGYALRIGQRHNITFTADYSRQSYSGSTTKPDSSEFGAVYLGYLYRH